MKTHVHTKSCTQMFIAGLFIIAKKYKQCKCPWTGEYVSRKRCVCPTEYDFTIKRNEVMIHTTTGMNLEMIMLNERSWSQKVTYYLLYKYDSILHKISRIGKFMETETRPVLPQGLEKREWSLMGTKSLVGRWKCPKIRWWGWLPSFCEHRKNHWTVQFKGWVLYYVNCISIKLFRKQKEISTCFELELQ